MHASEKSPAPGPVFTEQVELTGHIIDSLLLPKVLDLIMTRGGTFRLPNIVIGQQRQDPSYALIEVQAQSAVQLQDILSAIADHGATSVHAHDCQLTEADLDGAFPEGFYSSTNQKTEVRVAGRWIEVDAQEMDCGIVVDPQAGTARCVPMVEAVRGQRFVVGARGVRVRPLERRMQSHGFEFMTSQVSTEKPKGVAVRQIAQELVHARQSGGKILVVGGPAIVHTGSVEHLCRLIRDGYVQVLFAGNALATHDIENALFGTSLGVRLESGDLVEAGHEHHLRSINRMRRLGGYRRAVDQKVLTRGIMYECVEHGVDVVLCGSIRDDGPLPEVITDTLVAQRVMREKLAGVTFCLMIATTLHSIAVGNLLPAWVRVACVDINPATIIKLSDRGTFQTAGLVTDVEPFLRALVAEVELLSP